MRCEKNKLEDKDWDTGQIKNGTCGEIYTALVNMDFRTDPYSSERVLTEK